MDFHVSTVLVSIGLFLFVLQFPTIKGNPIVYVGEKLSMWIYLSHILVVSFIDEIAKGLMISRIAWYLWLRPIISLMVTILIAIILDSVKNRKKVGHCIKNERKMDRQY